jgi:hypothetical protein
LPCHARTLRRTDAIESAVHRAGVAVTPLLRVAGAASQELLDVFGAELPEPEPLEPEPLDSLLELPPELPESDEPLEPLLFAFFDPDGSPDDPLLESPVPDPESAVFVAAAPSEPPEDPARLSVR